MEQVIQWLLEGDVSIQYQTRKYLLGESNSSMASLRGRIAREGWGKRFLEARRADGHWGRAFYQMKWKSSHYTLLDLRYLEMEPVEAIRQTLAMILGDHQGPDGSIHESRQVRSGDVCINGMFLNYASYFQADARPLDAVVDFLLSTALPDGGFNCRYRQKDTRHSSMHTTLSVLEGFAEYIRAGHPHRRGEILAASQAAEEFLLRHALFRSERTGEVIDAKWLMLSFPSRWRYDILRALIYFADTGRAYDPRMAEALSVLVGKRRSNGVWPVQARHPGEIHFEMEKTGGPSRFNTLRALRVLQAYGTESWTGSRS